MESIQSEKDLPETFDLESNRYEYDPWLLDDHPLRSYPTECIPGLGAYLDETIGKRTKALLRAGSLPHDTSPHIHTRPQTGTCTFPTLDTRPQALEASLAAGCGGVRMPVWMHHGELQVGNAVTGHSPDAALNRLGLDPLLAKMNHAAASAPGPIATSSLDEPSETFLLMLDAKSPLHDLLPALVEQLDALRRSGHLSHWDGESVIERPVTVVVTSEAIPDSDCVNVNHSDIFWSAFPEARTTASSIMEDGLRRLFPVCVA
ncbi:uncharacterized protein N7506_008554 [Penicillium brevicompactum]|uniref:uncharacterized protein n=1 Tax=Penicillium brevicompactum TaxID=5074 RepID=UPI0025403CC2|nr:uncharacterized protein N7506_008554 [Penicillium brevicompactum]KAJ5325452.1 hypothetical protein N7506_008554 [Penicillium brevicompactum]